MRTPRSRRTDQVSGAVGMRSAAPALAVLVALACSSSASRAQTDVGRLVLGRVTYPAGSWTVDTFSDYTIQDVRDPAGDAAQLRFELEHGRTDRWTLEAGFITTRAQRDLVAPGRLALETRYLAVQRPLQLAVFAEWLPSLRSEAPEWELGIEGLKNYRSISLIVTYQQELERAPSGEPERSHALMAGSYYRFGLRGVAGAQWHDHSGADRAASALLGGAVSRSVFIGLEPRLGLSRGAPDFEINLQVQLHYGPYGVGSWLFE